MGIFDKLKKNEENTSNINEQKVTEVEPLVLDQETIITEVKDNSGQVSLTPVNLESNPFVDQTYNSQNINVQDTTSLTETPEVSFDNIFNASPESLAVVEANQPSPETLEEIPNTVKENINFEESSIPDITQTAAIIDNPIPASVEQEQVMVNPTEIFEGGQTIADEMTQIASRPVNNVEQSKNEMPEFTFDPSEFIEASDLENNEVPTENSEVSNQNQTESITSDKNLISKTTDNIDNSITQNDNSIIISSETTDQIDQNSEIVTDNINQELSANENSIINNETIINNNSSLSENIENANLEQENIQFENETEVTNNILENKSEIQNETIINQEIPIDLAKTNNEQNINNQEVSESVTLEPTASSNSAESNDIVEQVVNDTATDDIVNSSEEITSSEENNINTIEPSQLDSEETTTEIEPQTQINDNPIIELTDIPVGGLIVNEETENTNNTINNTKEIPLIEENKSSDIESEDTTEEEVEESNKNVEIEDIKGFENFIPDEIAESQNQVVELTNEPIVENSDQSSTESTTEINPSSEIITSENDEVVDINNVSIIPENIDISEITNNEETEDNAVNDEEVTPSQELKKEIVTNDEENIPTNEEISDIEKNQTTLPSDENSNTEEEKSVIEETVDVTPIINEDEENINIVTEENQDINISESTDNFEQNLVNEEEQSIKQNNTEENQTAEVNISSEEEIVKPIIEETHEEILPYVEVNNNEKESVSNEELLKKEDTSTAQTYDTIKINPIIEEENTELSFENKEIQNENVESSPFDFVIPTFNQEPEQTIQVVDNEYKQQIAPIQNENTEIKQNVTYISDPLPTRFCDNCGTILTGESSICPSCGEPIE